MDFYFLTIFPDLVSHYLSFGLLGKALEKGLLRGEAIDLRAFAENKAQSVDDRVYGGGPGMVFRPEPLARAIGAVKGRDPAAHVIYATPAGRPFKQADALRLVEKKSLLFIAGRYEGIDQRIVEKYVDEELSIGDYILSGGELPSLVMAEAVARLVPGMIGHEAVHREESFCDDLLEYPHYTRPEVFEDMAVPKVLLSGNHRDIEAWRDDKRREKTAKVRPDLLKRMAKKGGLPPRE